MTRSSRAAQRGRSRLSCFVGISRATERHAQCEMGAMRRASFALLMVFAAACGGATVTTLDGSKDAGTDGSSADGGGCTEPQPDIGCKCCNQPTSLECVNGAWQCRACTLACNIDGGVPDAG